MRWALLVVDVQRDFCEGGQLAAADTASLLEPLNSAIVQARKLDIPVVFTQDWHPANHHSFVINGGRWPIHCVAGSLGANLEPSLEIEPDDLVIHKGQAIGKEGYSAFESDILPQQMHSRTIEALAVCGIATDFCVRATALDAAIFGFKTCVLVDLTRAVYPAAVEKIFGEMQKAGIRLMQSRDWLNMLQRDLKEFIS